MLCEMLCEMLTIFQKFMPGEEKNH
jgi:hypothetical protein